MARHRLDAIDRKILAELQASGRMTNVELSRRAKITAPPFFYLCATASHKTGKSYVSA